MIWKKYQRQRQKKAEKTNKKASKWLKKAGFLGTDDLQAIDYNNDVSLDDIETVDFNDDTQMADLNDIDKVDLKKNSATQQTAKKILKIEKFKDKRRIS